MEVQIQSEPNLKRDVALVALVTAPFLLNDFLFMATETAPGWLTVDYGSKLLGLAIVIFVLPLRQAAAETLPSRWPVSEAAILAIGCAVFIIGADTFFRSVVPIEIESLVLFRYPALDSPVLYWTDITFGLLLTAVSEEIAFRGVFAKLMVRHLPNPVFVNLGVRGRLRAHPLVARGDGDGRCRNRGRRANGTLSAHGFGAAGNRRALPR